MITSKMRLAAKRLALSIAPNKEYCVICGRLWLVSSKRKCYGWEYTCRPCEKRKMVADSPEVNDQKNIKPTRIIINGPGAKIKEEK